MFPTNINKVSKKCDYIISVSMKEEMIFQYQVALNIHFTGMGFIAEVQHVSLFHLMSFGNTLSVCILG